MKTVTEIRRNSTRDTFTAESVDLAPNSLWDWKSVERLKQRSDDVVSFTGYFFQDETSSTVLNALKVVDRGSGQTRKERIAVVKA